MIPVAHPVFGDQEVDAVSAVIRSGMIASGEEVVSFEKEFADYCGTSEAIATSNGTTALHAGLLACGIKPGDEVIVPSFTFIATATSVSMCGARPVMVDVCEDSFGISPDAILESITPRTKAIIGVHLFGQPCNISAIQDICAEKNLQFIEDCAQAHGALYKGKKVGSFGSVGCFSFYPTKNMTTGEGGMITTSDSALADHIRRLINHGQSKKYLHTEIGYNYRLTNIGAAIGRVQLKKIDAMNEARKKNAVYISKNINHPKISLPQILNDCSHVFHQYVIRVGSGKRDELASWLSNEGVGTAIHYPIPVNEQPVYANISNPASPISSKLAKEVLSLPVYPGLSVEELSHICNSLNRWSC
ncbi:MAG: DegT/DnrJ/EryC1/StrS family aminotransferase [Methanomicrobiales archaeon]|nr:DegT/DnrJ/EryC1/StrS family aminotransferase [Methanomicrobiales archaeon]